MDLKSEKINKFFENVNDQALCKNDKSTVVWSKYKSDLEMTKSILVWIPKKMKHSVMVPVGPKALMRGEIVHTNELLVNLGETWFVKKTAHQTIEFCDRKIKSCDEMLEKLKKERELIINKSTLPIEQEAFGNEKRAEIIEYVTEEENEEWKKQHRLKEKKYRQQLNELKTREKKPIETEEDLWNRLDELELQEELEDELNRLHTEYNSEDVSEENSELDSLTEQKIQDMHVNTKHENLDNENKNVNNVNLKKKVYFACDLNSSDDEPLRLEIKHSDWEPIPNNLNSEEIKSPDDIYNSLNLKDKKPLSVLKHKVNVSKENNLECMKNDETVDDDDDDDMEEVKAVRSLLITDIQLNDVYERSASNVDTTQKVVDVRTKKISKFKKSRLQNL